jgi:putative membrane protein
MSPYILTYSSKEFIISLSGANTANAIFSLIALYTIHRTRSGAMVAINGLVNIEEWDISFMIMLLAIIVFVSILSYYATIYLGNRISGLLSKIDYSKLSCAVLIFLTLMVVMFTGWFGLVIFLISAPVGMVASFAKIRKTHAMGVILLPVILFFF